MQQSREWLRRPAAACALSAVLWVGCDKHADDPGASGSTAEGEGGGDVAHSQGANPGKGETSPKQSAKAGAPVGDAGGPKTKTEGALASEASGRSDDEPLAGTGAGKPKISADQSTSSKPTADAPLDTAGIEDFETWQERYEAVEDPERKMEFFAKTVGNAPAYLLNMVRTALKDETKPVRAEAMQATRYLPEEDRLTVLIETATSNEDEAIRGYALDDISQLPPRTKTEIYHDLLDSEHAEVRMVVAESLANISTPRAFELLLDGLDSSDAAQADRVSDLVEEMVGQRFDDRAAASAWWGANREKFDSTMSPD
jgi:hypothetical protein